MYKTLLFTACLLFHPVHVTLTSIDYSSEEGSYKVYVKMYLDDFLLDFGYSADEVVNDSQLDSGLMTRDLLQKYLGEKVFISVNDTELTGRIMDYRLDDNEININMRYEPAVIPGSITVRNMIMTGLYDDQSNLLIVRVDDFEKGVKMTSELTEQTFNIE
jgi:hypothetical protein